MKSIRYPCRLTCAYLHPCLITSGSDIGCAMGFDFGLTVGMVLQSPVGYPLWYLINRFLGLVIGNYFGTWENYLVGVSLVLLDDLMIGTGEVSLAGLSLGLQLGFPLKFMPGILLGAPTGLWFVSEAVRCLCCFCRLKYCNEATCFGVSTSCLPPSGAFIKY